MYATFYGCLNYGDLLNMYLLQSLNMSLLKSNKIQYSGIEPWNRQSDHLKIVPYNLPSKYLNTNSRSETCEFLSRNQHFFFRGSLMHRLLPNSIVLSTGCISGKRYNLSKTNKIITVRGELTKHICEKNGLVPCTSLTGDPALILPLIYNKPFTKKYKVGIVFHVSDVKEYIDKIPNNTNIRIIDFGINIDYKHFDKKTMVSYFHKSIDEINSCDVILSSSLHGIIIANAYNIPAVYLKSNLDTFKYLDYFSSMGLYKYRDEFNYENFDNEFKKYIDINDKNLYKTLDSVSLETDVFTTFQKEILLPQKEFLQDKSLRLYKLYHDFINKKIPMYNVEKTQNLIGFRYIQSYDVAGKSIIRFGDGELINILKKKDIFFQKYTRNLDIYLVKILQDTTKQLIKAAYFTYNRNYDQLIYKEHVNDVNNIVNASCFRLNTPEFELEFLRYIMSKYIIYIGPNAIDLPIFYEYIKIPSMNFYDDDLSHIKIVIDQILNKNQTEIVVVISGGPGGKVLAYELYQKGYQVIDFGNIYGLNRLLNKYHNWV